MLPVERIDRTAVRLLKIEELQSDAVFWKTQPHRLRWSTVEEIRREYHGERGAYPSDFRDFLILLNEHHVRHLIIDGYAVAWHGHPRYTKDIDIWLDRTPENARTLLDALIAFGVGEVELTEDDFLEPGQVTRTESSSSRS